MWHAIKRELRVGSGTGEEGTEGGRPELSDTSRSRGISFGTYDANLVRYSVVTWSVFPPAVTCFCATR